jgi:hypothetical protein
MPLESNVTGLAFDVPAVSEYVANGVVVPAVYVQSFAAVGRHCPVE